MIPVQPAVMHRRSSHHCHHRLHLRLSHLPHHHNSLQTPSSGELLNPHYASYRFHFEWNLLRLTFVSLDPVIRA
ncbi:hypothetical protein HanIR_Chr12g0608201 [Helianthus annuus]|nr:hypothetical protein HanIR_Chr12g0608201 [Helianthus annuus]